MRDAEREIARIHERYAPVDDRVAELRAAISKAGERRSDESWNRANERQVEEFITWLAGAFPGRTHLVTRPGANGGAWEAARRAREPCVVIERQRLSVWALRTTRWNYILTVPGDSPDQIVLVAHYDTWRGPGADDNTTGEEIVKQYLLRDLRAPVRPRLTHVYFLAGSEECGLVGLLSQLLLAIALQAANFGLTQQNWWYLAGALAAAPLASYRFGVSGSREYVRTLSQDELRRIRAVVSVDSVGEGRLYIPRGTMGADFLRILIPFGDYDSINDLLEEGAHLHGIKYNNFLAGGTTDHVSFLEVNNGLRHMLLAAVRRVACRLTGRPYTPPLRIPATALVAMVPGKASPVVFGGKIHTPKDTADRVYPGPLREALLILDYLFYRLEAGVKPGRPREPDECHYARLYRAHGEYLLALKDVVEPNRRNVNVVYRVDATIEGRRAAVRTVAPVWWGVDTRLRDEVREYSAELGLTANRVKVDELEVAHEGRRLHFKRQLGMAQRVAKAWHRGVAALQAVVRRFIFLTFFALAYALSWVFGLAFDLAFGLFPPFAVWFVEHATATMVVIIVAEVAFLLHLMARRVPAWIDNGYRHENRGDNLGSLRRQGT